MERIAVGLGAPQGNAWQPWPEFRLMPDEPPPPKNPSTSSGYPVPAEPEPPKDPSTSSGYPVSAD